MSLKLTEKQAAELGLIPKPEPVHIDAVVAYATGFNAGCRKRRRGAQMSTVMVFIAGWLVGFVVALMFVGR